MSVATGPASRSLMVISRDPLRQTLYPATMAGSRAFLRARLTRAVFNHLLSHDREISGTVAKPHPHLRREVCQCATEVNACMLVVIIISALGSVSRNSSTNVRADKQQVSGINNRCPGVPGSNKHARSLALFRPCCV